MLRWMPGTSEGWWAELFEAMAWARSRRHAVRGRRVPVDALVASVDLAAGALADPMLADALEAEHVDLGGLENALVHGAAVECDLDALRRGAGGNAWRLGARGVCIDDVFTHLVGLPEIGDACALAGLEAVGARWSVVGPGAARRSLARALSSAWPLLGRPDREAIVIDDHPTVTRAFVFDLLTDQGQLTSIAALRAIRRIEAHGRAAVFVGTRAAVDARYPHVAATIAAASSPLRVVREPA